MALLQSLQLQGIRSFGPEREDAQVVEFLSPVTLFLGVNGSGKTTIIESLKYACSGELPPNSENGRCFVFDPKINNFASTKGQIILKFFDVKGRTITVSKSMQVTQHKDKLQFASLDHTIKIRELDGKESTLSSRCVDIKTVIYDYLGVSKPVINNVIFCQQDNSLWPLDDGKKLKEKFDDIFNIGEYNNAVDILRKIVKTKKDSLKIMLELYKYAKEHKMEVDKKQASVVDKKNEIDDLQKEITEQNQALESMRIKLEEITAIDQKYNKIMTNIAAKESEKKSCAKQQETLLETITEQFEGSDEELNVEIETFQTKCNEAENVIKNLSTELQQLENKNKQIVDSINALQVKLGQLKEKEQQQKLRISKRDSLISELCAKSNVTYDNVFDNELINTLKQSVANFKTNLLETTAKHKREEKKIQDKIVEYKELRASTVHDIQLKKTDILDTQAKFREISGKLHDLNVSDEQMNTYLQKITRIEKELESLNKSYESDKVSENMRANKERIVKLETEQEELEKEYKLLQKNTLVEHEIETKKLFLVKRESDISKLKDKHYHTFASILPKMPQSNFKEAVQNRVIDFEKTHRTLSTELAHRQKDATYLELEKENKTKEYKSTREKFAKSKEIVRKACKGESYDKYVNDLHLAIEGLQKDKGEYKSLKIMYEKYIKHLRDEQCCPVCETGFKDKKSRSDALINKMATEIRKLPEKLASVEEQLLAKQNQYSELLQLRTANDEITELEVQLPRIEKDIQELEEKLSNTTAELNIAEETLTSSSGDLKMCNDVIADCTLIDQYALEVDNTRREIANLEPQLVTVPSKMSLHQLEEQLEDRKEELSNTRKLCDSLQRKTNQNNERRQQLGLERNNLVEKQLNLQKNMQGRPLLEDQRSETIKREESLKTVVEELKQKEISITKALAEEKDKLEQLKEANEAALEVHQTEYAESQKLLDEIVKLHEEVEQYVKANAQDHLSNKTQELSRSKSEQEKTDALKEEVAQKINAIRRQLGSQSVAFKALKENLRLRQLQREEQESTKAIEALKRELHDYDYKTIQEEKIAFNRRHMIIEQETIFKEGNLSQLRKGTAELEKDLRQPRNVNAYKDYKRRLFEMLVTEAAIKDADNFSKVLENAIIKFHATRMQQINVIIRELWQSIYKGNDIEYIQIKANDSSSTKTRRVYNYKVVQFRNNAELDMSGRCSAGQKVLACLVIRMALAETFSHNCGILALDEPTTNLDRENIESLCEALCKIINNRQNEKNFQLLIITHDEYFLNSLRTLGVSEYYYNVSRSHGGTSVLTKQAF